MVQTLVGWLVGLVALCAWGSGALANGSGLKVVVTIPPLKGIVEPLLPQGSTVKVLMPPGRSEHNYEFTPADMASVGGADLVVFVGLGLEPQVAKFLESRASPKRVDLSLANAAGVNTGGHENHEHHESHEGHEHAKGEECDHSAADPHVWLDPVLVKGALPRIVEAVIAAMKMRGEWEGDANTAARQRLESALASEVTRVDELDAAFREKLAPFKSEKIVTHHAAFGRLAERYGLEVAEVIRVNEGEEPTPGRIAAIVQAVRKEGVKAIFVEPQFDSATAERVAKAAGVQVVTLDPLGDGDWFAMMRGNLSGLVQGLSAETTKVK
jgi:zinc transport system substrate-binding protein